MHIGWKSWKLLHSATPLLFGTAQAAQRGIEVPRVDESVPVIRLCTGVLFWLVCFTCSGVWWCRFCVEYCN